MIRVGVWMTRAALLYLGTGFTFGMLMLFNKGIPFDPSVWRLLPVHIECLLIGWLMQFAMGTVTWIMPRFSTSPRYGNLNLAWAAFLTLNIGIFCASFGQWSGDPMSTFIGRSLELVAAVCFALHIWSRVKPLSVVLS
jgi:hypothetical protein